MVEVVIQLAICVAWGLASMGVLLAVVFVFGCVMSAFTHKDFEPYEWHHYVGWVIITLAVLVIVGALIRPDWSI
jgi:cytochrome b561